jgi:hypothetical protein
MALELKVIRASDFVCLGPDEHLDLEASKEALRTMALACLKRGLGRALIDLRKLPVLSKPHFTKTELAALVESFSGSGFSHEHRLALVYREDLFGGVRDFAFISRMRGLQVQAFTDVQAAMHWLWEGQEVSTESKQKPDTVFIRKPKQRPATTATNVPHVICPSHAVRVRPHARH